MRLSEQQEQVWDQLRESNNVVAHAVPGAGKTTMILELCRRLHDKTILVLAYNADLASKMVDLINSAGLQERVSCFTFHGLCSHCISLAPDDATFEQCLEMVFSSQKEFKTLHADIVIMDEAQDLKTSFITLVNLVCDNKPQFFMCGDPHQMIYDFDPEFAANLEIIKRPKLFLPSNKPWVHTSCNVSYRLTQPVAKFVNVI